MVTTKSLLAASLLVLLDLEYPLAHLRLKCFESCIGLLGKDPVFRPIEKGWDYTGVE